MVITKRIINNIYSIDIPDEGVQYEKDGIDPIKAIKESNMILVNKYQILSECCQYYYDMINEILSFIENNERYYNYEFLSSAYETIDTNYVVKYIVKGTEKSISKLSSAISELIKVKRENYN